ncbi:MAG: hypothetical protein EXR72_19080 [Myxococcales bacterium]|nr:hypothetical protein [Myxococcales bacterium]
MKRALAVLLSSLAVTVATRPVASAVEFKIGGQPLRLDVTESLFLNAHLDPGNGEPSQANYGELLSRLNVQLAWRRFLVGLRYDLAAYVHTPAVTCDPATGRKCEKSDVVPSDLYIVNFPRFRQTYYDPKKFLEKMFLSYSGRSFDFTVGDFYVNFGRGLVLSIRKVDELGVDTTLLGGKFAVHEGDFSLTGALGWTNIQNLDESTAAYTNDPYDFIAGVRADYRAADKVILGMHFAGGVPSLQCAVDAPRSTPDGQPVKPHLLGADRPSCPAHQDNSYQRYGITFDAPRLTPWMSLYAEYAHADDQLEGKQRTGDALYGAATAFHGRFNWLLETKVYRNYQPWHSTIDPFGSLVYMQAPTLERVQTQINNNTDLQAARVRLDARVNGALTLYGSVEAARSHPHEGLTNSLVDSYVGAQVRWNEGRSQFFPLAGFRYEHDDTGNALYEQLVALEFTATQALPGGFSIEAAGLLWLRDKPGTSADDWREGNLYVSLKWAPRFILAAGYEWTTVEGERLNRHNFFNGSIQWNITSGTSIRLFGGGQRPGLKCISGVCRVFPSFEGAKLEVVVRL